MSINLDTMSSELIEFERPTILSKTPDNKLLIYGYEEGRGFYFTTYDPVIKTESDRIYKEYPLKFLTACDQDTYVFTSSVNPSQSITIGSLKIDGVIELPTNDFIFKKSRYKDGIFYYINQNKITKVDISSNLDFSNIKPIHIISTEYVASTSSYGYQLDFKQLEYDEFALTVLSLDKSYDISYTYSNQDFAANLRDKGSFYPLNDIEGVKEYIDACFPALREIAINDNGEIWMIPIYMQVPCVVFDKDLCRDLNINLSSNLLFKDFVSIIKTLYSDDEYKAVYHVNSQYITKIAIEQYLSENKSFNTTEFTELAQIIKDEVFRNEKAFDMSDEIRTAWMSEDRKNVAFETVNHLSEISLYEKIGRNFDIIPLPKINGNVNYYAVCLFATVNPNSLNLSTTLAYISKLVKEMNLTDYDPNRYYAGSYNIKTAEIYSYNDFYRNLGDIMNNSKINFSMSNELFLKDFYRYLEDKITLEDFISEADRKLHAYLNE